MASPIQFKKDIKRTEFLDPRNEYKLSEVETEIRYDPLTGSSSRICHFSRDKMPAPDLTEMVEASTGFCPFCPEHIDTVTPKYPDSFLEGGRLTHGDAKLFPNLFPYDDVSALAIISSQHFLPMDNMPVQALVDGISIAQEFFQKKDNSQTEGQDFYSMVTWNYMPPAGSSLIHPHLQVLHTSNPGNAIRREIEAENKYHAEHKRNYMEDLIASEKTTGERWVGSHGATEWFVPFSPTGIIGDVIAAFPGKATLADLSADDIREFSEAMNNILNTFTEYGLWSYNFGFFPAADASNSEKHTLYARIVPRIFVNPMTNAGDASYMQFLIEERVAMVYPEVTAERLRGGWKF
ncbi:MAG: hypothetical protein KUG72_11095 [Pseudomonadales bacterium]|nr:hypothetical protein [Pseudomonadales bacterium]